MNAAGLRSFTTNFVQHSFINLSYRGRPPPRGPAHYIGAGARRTPRGTRARAGLASYNHKLKFYS